MGIRLSEYIRMSGIDEEVDKDDIDISKLIKDIKELMELSQKYNVKSTATRYTSTTEVQGTQPQPQPIAQEPQPQPSQQQGTETKEKKINDDKLKQEIKNILAIYKDNPLAGSFSIKDGIEYVLNDEKMLETAVKIIKEAVNRSLE